MKFITRQTIIDDYSNTVTTAACSISTGVGIFMVILPFILSRKFDANSLILSLVFLVSFGVMFGYVFGLKKLIHIIKVKKCLKNGDFVVIPDIITDIYSQCDYSGNDPKDHQLTLERYSKQTGKNVCVPFDTFRQLREGDRCVVVLCKASKESVLTYSGNEYVIDKSLADKISC